MTTVPSIGTLCRTRRMASTAAPSAPSLSPRPIQRAPAIAAASVTRTSSSARFRAGILLGGTLIASHANGRPGLSYGWADHDGHRGDRDRDLSFMALHSSLVPGAIQTDVARHSSAARHLSAPRSRPSILAWVAGVVVTAVGIGLRFYEPSALWLDETISVNISRLPLFQIPGGLRQDGAPPLYYVLLHFWMLAFGNSDVAVRSMSGVISVVTLPLLWLAGRRLGGRRLGWIVYFLAVTSPFLIEYATTTRMYSLMMLMSTLGFLALASALRSPKPLRLVLLGLVTAGNLYTHHWGLPTRQNPAAVWRCLVAMAVGSLLFIPWAPIFVFQSLHTGTPWTSPAGPADLLNVFTDFAGGNNGPWAELLSFCYFGLLAVGVFVRPALISGPRGAAHADGGRDGEAGLAVGNGDGAGIGDETGDDDVSGNGDGTGDDDVSGNGDDRHAGDGDEADHDGTTGNGAAGNGAAGNGSAGNGSAGNGTLVVDEDGDGSEKTEDTDDEALAPTATQASDDGLGVGGLRLTTAEALTGPEAELAADLDREAEGIGPAARRGLDRAVGWAGFGPGGSAGQRPGASGVLLLARNPQTLPLFGVLFGTLLVAMLAGAVAQAAFVARYASVVLPLFLLIVASGLTIIGRARLVAGVLAVMCIGGVVTGYTDNSQPRTQAVQAAQVLHAQAQPGDVVVYCPDQVGPAVDRLLKVPQVTELTFPRAIGPQRVDWINYLQVIHHTNVEDFAQDMASRVGPNNSLWLVWNRSYHGFGRDCGDLETWLSYFLPGSGTTLFQANSTYYENELLTRYPSEATS